MRILSMFLTCGALLMGDGNSVFVQIVPPDAPVRLPADVSAPVQSVIPVIEDAAFVDAHGTAEIRYYRDKDGQLRFFLVPTGKDPKQ